MKYCCDCAYMEDTPNKNGLFKCENARKSQYSLVSARMHACSYFCGAWHSKRGEVDRIKMMNISREHGYYIITALTEMLGLDSSYGEHFKEFKENTQSYFEEFFEAYEEEGPKLETKLVNDPHGVVYANYLLKSYVNPFVDQIKAKKYFDAYVIYVELFNNLLTKYEFNDYIKRKK